MKSDEIITFHHFSFFVIFGFQIVLVVKKMKCE